MVELEALKMAGIYVFSVAITGRAPENTVRAISSWPQLANVNYFLSSNIPDLDDLSDPMAAQVFIRIFA